MQSNPTKLIDSDVQDPFTKPDTKVTTPYYEQVVTKRACNQPDSLVTHIYFHLKSTIWKL
jgi:hypothetical protein